MNEDMKPFSASTMEPRDPHLSLALPPATLLVDPELVERRCELLLGGCREGLGGDAGRRLVVEEGLGQ